MGWEVQKILRGQSKQCLLDSNLKTGTFLPCDCQNGICHAIFRTMPPLQSPSGGFELFYRHSNISYGDPFSRGSWGQGRGSAAGGGATGENLTCPILVQIGLLEWHWPTDHEYINFFILGPVFAEIFGPKFPTQILSQISNMAANKWAIFRSVLLAYGAQHVLLVWFLGGLSLHLNHLIA